LIKRRFRLAFSLLSAVPTVRLSIAFDARSARAARCRSEGADFVFTERPSSTSSVHTFVFRSYNLILQSDEPDLMRDVCFDIDKAQTKLARIRRQLQHDREHAAGRAELLTSAEKKLSAAIVAAESLTHTPASLPEVEQPRTNGGAMARRMARRREFNEAMRRRIRDIAVSRIFPSKKSSQR
jgi:hypothetical protein